MTSVAAFADDRAGVAFAAFVGARGVVLRTRLPDQVAVVLGEHVAAAAAVADVVKHLMPCAGSILALG